MSNKKFNTNQPPHLVANSLIRAIEDYLWEDGKGVKFGEKGHNLVEDFVNEYNDELSQMNDAAAKSDIENQNLKKQINTLEQALNLLVTKGNEVWEDMYGDRHGAGVSMGLVIAGRYAAEILHKLGNLKFGELNDHPIRRADVQRLQEYKPWWR